MFKSNNQTMVTVMECKYCDGTMSHNFLDTQVCISCGAEWKPVAVKRSYEDVYGPATQDVEKCSYSGHAVEECPCPECDTDDRCAVCSNKHFDAENLECIHEEGICLSCKG